MNLVLRMVLVALVLVAPCWSLSANDCYAPRYYNNYPTVVKKEAYYENSVLVATFVPLVVTVPTYSATYVPGYAPAPVVPAANVAQPMQNLPASQPFGATALDQKLELIVNRLTQIETQLNGGVSATGQGNDFQLAFASNCGQCHGPTPMNNNFSFVNADKKTMRQLTDREVGKVMSRILRDKSDPKAMPPASAKALDQNTLSLLASACDGMLNNGNGMPAAKPPANQLQGGVK